MLRILVLSTRFPDPERPGLGNFIERQYRELASRPGVAVEIVAPRMVPWRPFRTRTPIEVEEWRGMKVHRPAYSHLPYLHRRAPRAIFRSVRPCLAEIRRLFPFDLITGEFFWPEGLAAARLAAACKVPYLVKARGLDFDRWAAKRRTAKAVLGAGRGAARLLAVSDAVRESMIRFGLPAERIFVHHTGIDRQLFRPGDRDEARAALRIEGPLFLCVGNLLPGKRQALVIEALSRLDHGSLIVVGGGPQLANLERCAAAHGVQERVRMLGHIPNALMPALYGAADVTIHAASAEGLANVWVESVACGTPLVATDAGGIRDVINRPEAGRIVAPEPDAIADAVRELLVDPPDRDKVAMAVKNFSWERNARELEAHFRSVVGSPPEGRNRLASN